MTKRYYPISFLFSICFLLFGKSSYAQEIITETPQLRHLIFDEKDGLLIDQMNSMVFDTNNWLWLSGINSTNSDYKLRKTKINIQRFNGEAFYNVNLPKESLNQSDFVFIKKRTDNLFYVNFIKKNGKPNLYLLNPNTFVFQKIKIPKQDGLENSVVNLFAYNDYYFVFVNNKNSTTLYRLSDDLKFTYLSTFSKMKSLFHFNFKKLEDSFSLGFTHMKTITINTKGVLLKNRFTEEIHHSANTISFEDKKGNFVTQNFTGPNRGFTRTLKGSKSIEYLFNTKQQTYYNITSRNLEKELFFSKNGKLHYLIFTPPNISFFLKDYSIRSIVQINKEEVIVTTENNGWFLVDLKTAKVKNFTLKKNNKLYKAHLNRNLMKDTNGYWGNDNFGIIYIDKETHNVTSYSNTKKSFTLVQDPFSIYYTSYDFDIMQFDKRTKENHLLIATDSLDFQDIIKRGESLYLVSDKGLSHYKDGVLKLYKPNNKEDVFLMSLDDNETHGLLVGSLSGKLFRFNTESHTFELLYQDKLGASIASVLVDDSENIWINTFAGIVNFNPKDKSTTRYTTSDGLSHNEANRHSATKTKDGSFLVGTLKGLNYFHPDSLSNISTDASLKFASLYYFNSKIKAFNTVESPVELAQIKNIVLPSNNRTLIAYFGLLGAFLNKDVNYRYRLDSQNWISLGATHELQLINLAPGSYNLEIEALDATKNKIGDSLVLAILSKEVFYKTWWFVLAVVIMILAIILIYTKKANETKLTELKNKLLKVEIKQKHSDLTEFAMNISRNQIWGKQILEKITGIRNSRERGRAKGKQFDLLEKEIKNRMLIEEHSLDYQKQIDDLNRKFYENLIQTYPNLSKTEVKLCALLRLDLSNNEIAVLQNIALESVYKSRSRIRKKLNLSSDTDLNLLLKGF